MADEKSKEAGTGEGTKAERQLADIVRGTLPHPLVYLIRFQETGNKEADIAKKYGTTSGKVADIVKGRNFAYIDKDYKPTEEAKAAALKWLKAVPGYDANGTDAVVVLVEGLDTASAEDVAALAARRADVRAKNAASSGTEGGSSGSKGGKTGGGNKGGKKGAKAEAPTDKESADLMN